MLGSRWVYWTVISATHAMFPDHPPIIPQDLGVDVVAGIEVFTSRRITSHYYGWDLIRHVE